jgi:hypothetical protein
MLGLMDGLTLSSECHTVVWALAKNGTFSTVSLHREILFPSYINNYMVAIWETALPMKIKIFLWQVSNDRLQSAESAMIDYNLQNSWPRGTGRGI